MKHRFRFSLTVFSLVLVSVASSAFAQTTALSPDRKAYTEATRIKEPDKKITALEKFVADFPKSSSVYSVHQAIFETLVKNQPAQKERILAQAKLALEKAPPILRPNLYDTLANKLYDAGVLLEEAEKFASQGLAAAEEELLKQAKQRRAGYYATLGRIYLKQGKLKEAEQKLKQAREFNPNLLSASVGLAELYSRQGNEKQALEEYAAAAVSGKLSTEVRSQFETLYRKAHNGTLQGLEELLDARYAKLNPPAVKVEHFTPPAKRSNRTVLAEVFTGSGCPPCVAADLGFDAMLERYNRAELDVLMYHLHIPQPDPMTNPATQARSKFYSVQGVPSYALDGKSSSGGGGRDAAQGFYDRVNVDIERQLETAAGAELKLDAVLDNSTVKAKVAVSNVKSEAEQLKLHIVLAEERLRYTGENGIRFHPLVVRSLAGSEYGGLALTKQEGQGFAPNYEWSFDLKAISAEIKKHLDEYEQSGHRGETFTFGEKKFQLDPDNLTVVAFVQEEKSKTVLQAVTVKVKRAVAVNGNE